MSRAAYVVMSHRLPGQLVRMIRTLRALSPSAAILVHHDPRHSAFPAAELASVGDVTVLPPRPVTWGRASQLDLMLDAFGAALALGDVDWVFLLSGQDYPLRPLSEIEADVRAAPFDGYLGDRVIAGPQPRARSVDEFALRYFYAWRPAAARIARLAQAARPFTAGRELPAGALVARRRWRTPFTAARPCRAGSDWLTLNAAAAQRLVHLRDDADGRRLLRHYRATLLPTESLPHTVLWADPELTLSSHIRRHMQWDADAAHPQTLGAADLPAAIASGNDFARKFDSELDPSVLDLLDAHLGVSVT